MGEGKTILLTTHNANHALAVKSLYCFLKQSEIISYGSSREIIKEDLLHKIYGNNLALDHGQKTDSVIFYMANNNRMLRMSM